jgi:hypothetical protein
LTRAPASLSFKDWNFAGFTASKCRKPCKELVMACPDKQSNGDGPPRNEDLFRLYIAFVAIAVLLTLSLPLLA